MEELKNAHALLIGIGADLPLTVRDASALYNVLADDELAGYPLENILLLTEKEATREGILDAFDTLIERTNNESSVLLFYSGHGGVIDEQKQFYLVPNNFDVEEYETTWVKAEELREKISKIKSKRLVFFLDCCHAGGMTTSIANESATASPVTNLKNADGLAHKIDDGRGMSIVSSCREDQISVILEGDSNSLYTKCLLEVLKGEHKNNFEEPFIRISDVVKYLLKRVPEIYEEQNPFANLLIYDDFVLSKIPVNQHYKVRSSNSDEIYEVSESKGDVVTSFKESKEAKNLLIFLHGFSGEASATFGEMPNLLANEESLDGWDIIPFGYSENVNPLLGKNIWASKEDINRISDYLTSSIKYKFDKYTRVAIVSHSLGGIVAQQTILNLDKSDLGKISHLIMFSCPSNGVKSTLFSRLLKSDMNDLNSDGSFINQLRMDWNSKFPKENYPFKLKVVSGTGDEYVPVDSSFNSFSDIYQVVISGSHFNIVNQKTQENDSYRLILDTISNNDFSAKHTNEYDVNLLLGEYQTVITKLGEHIDRLDETGLVQLAFAYEGLDDSEKALSILKNHKLVKGNSDLLAVIGGRYKRKYLNTSIKDYGVESFNFYSDAIAIAEDRKDYNQIYYHAINLAFLSLVLHKDQKEMKKFAKKALRATAKDEFENLWNLATNAEAHLYLGDFESSKVNYLKASKMAGVREKISMYLNASAGYSTIMNTTNPEDSYLAFLKKTLLT